MLQQQYLETLAAVSRNTGSSFSKPLQQLFKTPAAAF
jgi:hypothetical protein